MKIKFVPRTQVKVSRSSGSKYKALIDALDKLEIDGEALEVSFTTDKELNSLRNVVYGFARESGRKIKSGKDAANKNIYFYRVK